MPLIRHEGLTPRQVFFRGLLILALGACVAVLVHAFNYTAPQMLACTMFAMTVLATLFFWEFRLAIAFLGIVALFAGNVLTLDQFVDSCELPVILFLVGMMVTVGVLKELGFFSWIIQLIVSPWWLARFRFGPAEWVWRCMTYLRIQPLRRRPITSATPELSNPPD